MASPRHPRTLLLILLRCQTLHILIPATERQRIRSASPLLLLRLIINHPHGTGEEMEGKAAKSRTDEGSWINSRTDSEQTCSRGIVEHASCPSLLFSTSPFSFPALPNLNTQLEPARTEICGTESTFSLFLFLCDPSSFPPCRECVALLFRVH